MDKNINPENRDTVFGDVNAPGADHSPKKFDLNASLPEVDNEDPFENGGKVLVQPEKGGREALSFKSGQVWPVMLQCLMAEHLLIFLRNLQTLQTVRK
jgi:hypothetical protein